MVADEWLLVDLYYECLEELNKKPNKNIKKKERGQLKKQLIVLRDRKWNIY